MNYHFKPKKARIYTRSCRRCGIIFQTYSKFGKVCLKCQKPRGIQQSWKKPHHKPLISKKHYHRNEMFPKYGVSIKD